MLGPRKNRWTWDDSYMSMALNIAQRSPDPNTQVGCILCTQDYRPVSWGYNGVAKGIKPETVPWDREGEPGKTKYEWVIHSERNAIDNAIAPTKDAICYVTLFPCHDCMNGLIQAGIKEVVYLDDKYKDTWFSKLARDMANRVDIKLRQHKWSKHYSNSK